MKTSTFTNELTKSSAVFGRKHDIKVVFTGDSAATNGETIKLPAIDKNSNMTDEQMDILRGYVDHEAGHVKHTDHAAVRALGEECRLNDNMHLKSVWNALEDIWLERRVMDDYPGAAHNLAATTNAVNKEFLELAAKKPDYAKHDNAVAAVAITWEGRKSYGGPTCQQCLDLINEDLRNTLPKWVGALEHCRTTQDVIALARVVHQSLRDEDYKEKPEDEPRDASEDTGDGEERSEPSASDDNGDEERSDDAGASEDSTTGDEDDGSDGGTVPDDGIAEGEVTPDDAEPEPFDPDLGKHVETLMKRGELTSSDGFSYVTYDEEDAWHHRTLETYNSRILRDGNPIVYDNLLHDMAGEVNSMRNKLMRSLVAKQKRDWDYGREDGRLDTRRFTQAFGGRTNVFKMRTDSTELDTAVTVLVDLSGSMHGSKIKLATQCCIAMCESLDKAGVAYEVLGFTNEYTYPETLDVKYDRLLPLHMFIFKQFDERLFEAKGSIAAMKDMALWDNSDGDAVAKAHARLLDRQERRRVMLVLSDGYPECSGDRVNIDRYTRNAVNDVAKSGTDIIGIGIISDAVRRYYPKYTVVKDVSDLAGAAMDQLSKALLGDRFQVDNSKLMDVS